MSKFKVGDHARIIRVDFVDSSLIGNEVVVVSVGKYVGQHLSTQHKYCIRVIGGNKILVCNDEHIEPIIKFNPEISSWAEIEQYGWNPLKQPQSEKN